MPIEHRTVELPRVRPDADVDETTLKVVAFAIAHEDRFAKLSREQRRILPVGGSCDGCRRCCDSGSVPRIVPGDDPTLYDLEPHDWLLDHRQVARDTATGNCIYLGTFGCTLAERGVPMPMQCVQLAPCVTGGVQKTPAGRA